MFNVQKKNDRHTIDEEINLVLETLVRLTPTDPDYLVVAKNLESLCRASSAYSNNPTKVAKLSAATNLIGLLAILLFERNGVITSKAFSILSKVKL